MITEQFFAKLFERKALNPDSHGYPKGRMRMVRFIRKPCPYLDRSIYNLRRQVYSPRVNYRVYVILRNGRFPEKKADERLLVVRKIFSCDCYV